MTLQSFLIYLGVSIVLSIAAHWLMRRYWLAVLVSIKAASLVNVVHEVFLHDFQFRPVDVLFWIPLMFVEGMFYALPTAALVGVPFYVIRRRHHSNAA